MMRFLMCMMPIMAAMVKGESVDCEISEKTTEKHIIPFLTDSQTCRRLRENFDIFSTQDEMSGSGDGQSSEASIETSHICHSYRVKFNDPEFKINITGCFSSKHVVTFSFSSLTADRKSCNATYINQILGHLNTVIKCDGDEPGIEHTPLPTTRSTTPILITKTTSSIIRPTTTTVPFVCTCPECKTSPVVSSSTSTPKTTKTTTRTTTPRTSLTSSSSPSTSWPTTSSSSSTSSTSSYNADELRGPCNEGEGQGMTSVVAIATASFLAGILVVLLFLWILHLKRTRTMCFRQTEKPTERLTSDKVTKKVLAKHMLSERKEPHTSNTPQSTTVHYVSEHAKDIDKDTEGMYTYIDGPETTPQKPNISGSGLENGGQYLRTGIQTPGNNSTPPAEEHVYNRLDLGGHEGHSDQHRGLKVDAENNKQSGQRAVNNTNSDVFDRGRDSTVSDHVYLVLQNENFRTSGQPEVPVSDGAPLPGMNTTSGVENTENAYFILNKE